MPNPNLKPLPLIFLLLAFFAFSCSINPCKKVDCGEHGECIVGDCFCEAGWKQDANGACTEQDLCFGKQCGNGTCNPQTGNCDCEPGWLASGGGSCIIEDLCYQVDCGDHGTCNDLSGACECDPGYALDANSQCNFELRGRFIGTWTGNHTDGNGNPSAAYTMTITRDPSDDTKVRITNFMNFVCSATNQPADGIGAATGAFEELDEFAFLCSDYDASSAFNSATMLTDNDLRMVVKVTSGFTTWNLTGVYQRQ